MNMHAISMWGGGTKEHAKKLRVAELESKISDADEAYFHPGTSRSRVSSPSVDVPDEVYDAMVDELGSLEPHHPLVSGSKVGRTPPSAAKNKVKLPHIMGSLDKIKHGESHRFNTWSSRFPGPYILSDKLDGVSALYVSSPLQKLYTRGDGVVGQDVSHLLPLIPSISPKDKHKHEAFTIRGELIMTRRDFAEHYQGKNANARNIVAGAVNAKRPDLHVLKHVKFVAYEVVEPQGLTVAQQFEWLKKRGNARLEVVHHFSFPHRSINSEKQAQLYDVLIDRRSQSQYDIDGLVVAQEHAQLTRQSKSNINYANAVAYKSRADGNLGEAVVSEVKWSVTKDGLSKPVVLFSEPLQLSGVSIQRATGFNAEFINNNNVGPGAKVLVTRSGDVIPHILRVTRPSASGSPQLPTGYEHGAYAWTPSGKDMFQISTTVGHDKERGVRLLAHFAEKMGIEGMKASTAEKLYEAGIHSPGQLVRASAERIASVPGIGRKNADKLVAAIQTAVNNADCVTLMQASNAFGQGFGERKLRMLYGAFPHVFAQAFDQKGERPGVEKDDMLQVRENDLISHAGIQTTTARSFIKGIYEFRKFQRDNNIPCLPSDAALVTATHTDNEGNKNKPLAGEVFVFSGFRDKDMEAAIQKAGGSVSSSVSSKTAAVVVENGTESHFTSKTRKAQELGVRIMQRSELKELIMSET